MSVKIFESERNHHTITVAAGPRAAGVQLIRIDANCGSNFATILLSPITARAFAEELLRRTETVPVRDDARGR